MFENLHHESKTVLAFSVNNLCSRYFVCHIVVSACLAAAVVENINVDIIYRKDRQYDSEPRRYLSLLKTIILPRKLIIILVIYS